MNLRQNELRRTLKNGPLQQMTYLAKAAGSLEGSCKIAGWHTEGWAESVGSAAIAGRSASAAFVGVRADAGAAGSAAWPAAECRLGYRAD